MSLSGMTFADRWVRLSHGDSSRASGTISATPTKEVVDNHRPSMSPPGKLAAFAVGVVFLVVVIGLLLGGFVLGVALGPRLDHTSAMLISVILALTPGAIVFAMPDRKSLSGALASLASLLAVMSMTFNIHAVVWVGPHLRPGSIERVLTVLSALIWPALATVTFAAAISRRTGERFGRMASLTGPLATIAINVAVVWLMIAWLAGTLPDWLIIVMVVSASLLLQFVLVPEVLLLMVRRGAAEIPPSARKAKADVEALTQTPVDGPVVVDRGNELSAEVRWRLFRRPVLILSSAMARLDATMLLAVIAHEYAHVSLNHLRTRLAVTIGSWLLAISFATWMQVFGLIHAPQPVATAVVLSAALIAQRFVLSAYVRKQEREADQFAASIAGADAVRAALRMTAVGPVIPSSFSIWMTHDTAEVRQRALHDPAP